MREYYHSVTLNKDKCMGCTNCIKRCPTEAIRVRDGKAWIIDERCNSIPIDPKTLQKAEEEGVAILSSDMNTFELSGVLYQLGIGSKR